MNRERLITIQELIQDRFLSIKTIFLKIRVENALISSLKKLGSNLKHAVDVKRRCCTFDVHLRCYEKFGIQYLEAADCMEVGDKS